MNARPAGPATTFLAPPKQHKTLVFAALPHSYDGSSYYRVWLPFKHLTDNSFHATAVADPGGPQIGPEMLADIDVLTLQRPAGVHGLQMIERLAGQAKLVYECDDDMLNVESAGLPHLHNERVRESVRRCLRLCDMVTVSSAHLAEILSPYNDNVVVLPNFVKQGLLDMSRPRRDRLTVGYAGGTSHRWDVEEMRNPLREVLDANPDVDMHFVGDDHSPIVGRRCRWTAWEKDVGHYYKKIDFDIAVAPSADHLFNRSKTPIRALEMAALGIPIVASNRLPYSEFVVDGKTGFLVDSEEEWRARLEDLIHDEAMRAELGSNARDLAGEWTIEGNWQLWESAYERAAGL